MIVAAKVAPSPAVVVCTGMGLVFAILIVICLLITAQGKLFDWLQAKQNPPKAELPKPPQPQPAEEDSVSPEILAAITAAAYAMVGECKICSVQPVKKTILSKSSWAKAGMEEATTPFGLK